MRLIHTIPHITSRKVLADLKKNPNLAANSSVVYVYFLSDRKISYPKLDSNILYIGEALRESEPTGKRFGQHITPTQTTGADTGNNLTLSQYFYNSWPIGLRIYESPNRKRDEADLIYTHIDLFGSPPVAQSKTPSVIDTNRTTQIFSYLRAEDNRTNLDLCAEILTQINSIGTNE